MIWSNLKKYFSISQRWGQKGLGLSEKLVPAQGRFVLPDFFHWCRDPLPRFSAKSLTRIFAIKLPIINFMLGFPDSLLLILLLQGVRFVADEWQFLSQGADLWLILSALDSFVWQSFVTKINPPENYCDSLFSTETSLHSFAALLWPCFVTLEKLLFP